MDQKATKMLIHDYKCVLKGLQNAVKRGRAGSDVGYDGGEDDAQGLRTVHVAPQVKHLSKMGQVDIGAE